MDVEQVLFERVRYLHIVCCNTTNIPQGNFYRATDKASLEEDFQDILDTFEKSRLVDYAVAERTEVFPYFIWFALLCVLLELILSQVIVRRFP